MLVRDLIAQLTALDPDLPVMMPAEDVTDFSEVQGAILETVVVDGSDFSLADERDPDLRVVVRLIGPYSAPTITMAEPGARPLQ